MRNAIIDNSTLTAVQRLMGEVELVNSAALDGDIAALEGLVQAILFYDNLFFVDDYKAEFRENRQKQFPFLTGLSKDEIHYDAFMRAASEVTAELGLRIRHGQLDKNEIGSFLNRVGILATFRWELQSSEFLLKMKMIEDSADRELFAAVQELVFIEQAASKEANKTDEVRGHYELLDSNGTPIPRSNGEGRSIPSQLNAFAGSVNWLAQRSIFYTYLASTFDADAILHPIRSDFQATIGPKLGMDGQAFGPILEVFSGQISSALKDITAKTDAIISQTDLPIFSAWLVNRTDDPRKILDAAFEVRGNEEFISLRNLLSELEDMSKNPDHSDYVRKINRLVQEIEKAGGTLREMYGVRTKNGVSIAPLITVINFFANLKGLPGIPNVPFKIKLPNGLQEVGMRKGFKGVFRSVLSDLVAIRKLGQYHDKLTSAVAFKGGRRMEPILPAVQPRRYMGYSSNWSKRFDD
ncbi:hypothetical protein FHV99_001649 [Ochrobactrum sp. P20RRXII]|nr:coiled-coil domain-containing protein 22 [Ochrobactrum sp. P20RRXII]NIH74442.1 hypothetical protein [Ochrobactrum sp. P20RRXII]